MKKRFWHKWFCGQYGGISPFMFGLLLGVSIFSISVQRRAEIEMDEMRKKQLQRQETEAESLRKGIELSVMTESSTSKTALYASTPDIDRIRQRSSISTGKTRGTQDTVMISGETGDNSERSRILITTTDDALVRDSLSFSKGGYDYGAIGSNTMQGRADTIVVDTTALRNQQVSISYKNMEAQASLVYNWWSNNGFLFPTSGEYNSDIMPISSYKDFWGSDFIYTRTSDHLATLSFTPPWGGTAYTITLDMSVAGSSSTSSTSSSSSGGCVDPGTCGKSERWVSDPYCLCTSCPLIGSPDGGMSCAPGYEFFWATCTCEEVATTTSSTTSSGSEIF